MAFRKIKFTYSSGICDFIADSVDDIKHLPALCSMGSSCYVISSSEKYFKNSSGKWICQSRSSNEISPGATFQNIIVDELPASGEVGILYLVPNSIGENNNTYTEYLYINNHWEQLGTIDSDLIPITTDSIDAYFQSS